VQAKSFFRAGMVDNFFATSINNVSWVLALKVVGREGTEMFVQMRRRARGRQGEGAPV
jgi:hypothetical protein